MRDTWSKSYVHWFRFPDPRYQVCHFARHLCPLSSESKKYNHWTSFQVSNFGLEPYSVEVRIFLVGFGGVISNSKLTLLKWSRYPDPFVSCFYIRMRVIDTIGQGYVYILYRECGVSSDVKLRRCHFGFSRPLENVVPSDHPETQ